MASVPGAGRLVVIPAIRRLEWFWGCEVARVREDRFVTLVSVIGGVSFAGFGVWAFLAPASFFDALARFEPYNAHFIRDIGAFQLGLGAVLLLSLAPTTIAAVALGGVGIGAAVHAVGHVIDRDLGGSPSSDIPTFAVLAIVLLWAAWRSHRTGAAQRPPRGNHTTTKEHA